MAKMILLDNKISENAYSPIRADSRAKVSGQTRVRFSAQTDTFSTVKPASTQPNVFQRFWNWLKSMPRKIQEFFRKLLGFKPAPVYHWPTPPPPKPIPFSHIDPKLVSDPYERRRISIQLADETFDEAVKLYQEGKTWTDAQGFDHNWSNSISKQLTEKAQKLLHTNTELRVKFLELADQGEYGSYTPPQKHVNGLDSSRASLGQLEVCHPLDIRYDLNKPAHRQMAYSVYLHEIEHMVRSYALNCAADSPRSPEPVGSAESKARFKAYTINAISHGERRILGRELRALNPHLPVLPEMDEPRLDGSFPDAALQAYWKPLKDFWVRTDFPLINRGNPDHLVLKKQLNQFLDEADPALVKQWMEHYVVSEFESYMTALKRAPGIPTNRLQPSDLSNLGAAMHLRDLLRYWYQHPKHRVPPSEQHPMTQVKPLEFYT